MIVSLSLRVQLSILLLLFLPILTGPSANTRAQQSPGDLPQLLIRANQSFVAGRYAEAAQAYEAILRITPQSVGAHNNLAICYSQLGKHTEAIDELKQALALSQNSPEINLNLGIAFLVAGRNEDALSAFQEALRLKPNWIAAQIHIGVTLSRLARYDESVEMLNRALRQAPNSVALLNIVGGVHAAAQNDLASLPFRPPGSPLPPRSGSRGLPRSRGWRAWPCP